MPTSLERLTPQQAQSRERRHCLTGTQIARLSETLPITAGRIHFVRKVQADGTVTILNETWKVGKRLAGRYIWATLITPADDWRFGINVRQNMNGGYSKLIDMRYRNCHTASPEFVYPKTA